MRRLIAALFTVAALVSCGVHTNRGATPDGPELIRRATEFSGFVVPPDAEVLRAHTDHGIDTRYQLAIRIRPDDLTRLLADSHFDKPLTKAYPPFEKVIAGPGLADTPSVVKAQDRFRNAAGTTVYRDVIVDQRDATTWYVHVNAFTT